MYEMKPEYYIGIDMIDEEHKQLFKYADEAYELLHDEYTPDKYDRIDIILENIDKEDLFDCLVDEISEYFEKEATRKFESETDPLGSVGMSQSDFI